MGVPAFFRWLSRKYPSIIVQCVEEKPKNVDETKIPVDTSKPNPNRVEFDNLYLDMNGIIHPCCHPENKPAPKNEDEMMIAIFEYIDRIFSIVRPRRLLYMAIDGVAPRAKMNQQRSRRFRAAKESVEKADEIEKIREELKSRGVILPPEKPKEEHFDSNCITPGTPFMARLAKCLHYYIHDRLNHDEGWKNISVILSDASAPGEGEHKIMDYIRRQRANPDHDPNTHHCLCGADADLIMLGLATHEPNFTIIREEFKPNQPKPCEICGQLGHEMKDCCGLAKEKVGEFDELEKPIGAETEFIFIRLNVLREYLTKELRMPNVPFEYDFERAVDDWVFMCFFVGNDFLPHLPSLEIREGAIDRLVNLYKDTVYRTGGFLTDSGEVNLCRVQLIMTNLGSVEDEIFKRRQENEEAFRKKRQRERKRKKLMNDAPAWVPQGQFAPNRINENPLPIQNARREAYNMRREGMQGGRQGDKGNIDAANVLRSMMKNESQNNGSNEPKGEKRQRDDNEDSDEEPVPFDAVRLWEDGWKDRYYAHKFDVSVNNVKFRRDVAAEYVKGLCWVLKYYYQGCTSWNWFFPYHYAPFASDFVNIGDEKIIFEKNTKPFNPLEQLMGVFPAASRQHLPKPWGDLMIDPESAIIDFYPEDFKVDLNGKKYAWQGVALLPFVDEQRLIRTLKSVYPLLTEEEKKRNLRGDDLLYVYKNHPGFSYMVEFYEYKNNTNAFDLSPQLFHGIRGKVLLSDEAVKTGDTVHSPIAGVEDIPNNYAICMRFRDPKYDDNFIFKAMLLKGAKIPNPVLKPDDFHSKPGREWRPQIGMAPSHQRASLDMSGKRALNWNMQSNMNQYNAVPPGQQYFGPKRGRGASYSGRYNPSERKYPDSYKSSERNRYSEGYKSSERNQYSESYKSSERSRYSESYKSSEGNQYSESFKSSERSRYSETENFKSSDRGSYSESFKQSDRGPYSDSFKSSERSSYAGNYNTADKNRYTKGFDSQAWTPSQNFVPSVRSSYPESYASQLKTQDSYSSQLKNQGSYASQLKTQDSYSSQLKNQGSYASQLRSQDSYSYSSTPQPRNQDNYTAQLKTYRSDNTDNSSGSISKYSGVARTSWGIGSEQRYITSRWSPAASPQSSVYDRSSSSAQQPTQQQQQQHSSLISSSTRSQIYQNPVSSTIVDGAPKQRYANAQSTYYRP